MCLQAFINCDLHVIFVTLVRPAHTLSARATQLIKIKRRLVRTLLGDATASANTRLKLSAKDFFKNLFNFFFFGTVRFSATEPDVF